MSRPSYLVRFDDICPTMNWDVWDAIEVLLVEYNIKPILAVVPNNQDRHLMVMPPRSDFWQRVRKWQEIGWSIALHGYEHRYETMDSGLVGLNQRSEFAGLPRDVQLDKLQRGIEIFTSQGVSVDAWVAPGHSFDTVTVELLRVLGVDVISDGYFYRPLRFMRVRWVPQQLWRFRHMPFGLWTVCMHPNTMSSDDLAAFESAIVKYRDRITSLSEVVGAATNFPNWSLLDSAVAFCWRKALQFKRDR